jgi:hypothetical protein
MGKKPTIDRSTIKIFIHAGGRPNSTGSSYGRIQENTGRKRITYRDGLTNHQADYYALLSAVKHLPDSANAEIFSASYDSAAVVIEAVRCGEVLNDASCQPLGAFSGASKAVLYVPGMTLIDQTFAKSVNVNFEFTVHVHLLITGRPWNKFGGICEAY